MAQGVDLTTFLPVVAGVPIADHSESRIVDARESRGCWIYPPATLVGSARLSFIQ